MIQHLIWCHAQRIKDILIDNLQGIRAFYEHRAFCSDFFNEVFIVIYMLAGTAHGSESHKRSNVHKQITIKCLFHASCLSFSSALCLWNTWNDWYVFWQMMCMLYSAKNIASWLDLDKSGWIIATSPFRLRPCSFIHWAAAAGGSIVFATNLVWPPF